MRTAHDWIDITVPVREGMPVWPGETSPRIWRSKELARDGVNVTELVLGAHTGTHVDAPVHFVRGGGGVESLPPDVLIGPARVLTVTGGPEVDRAALAAVPEGCVRLLLRTANRERWGAAATRFDADFVGLSVEAAEWLAERGTRLVGIDYLSVQPYRHERPRVHQALLGAGVVLLEGIDLSAVRDGDYELVCLPLLVPGADGAPARAVIRPIPID